MEDQGGALSTMLPFLKSILVAKLMRITGIGFFNVCFANTISGLAQIQYSALFCAKINKYQKKMVLREDKLQKYNFRHF